MSILFLDTCTFIWLSAQPERLSASAGSALDRANAKLMLSDASVWEICLKWQAKKINLPQPPRAWITEQVRLWQLERVPLEPEHFYRTVELPALHKDPFDRLLVAQALTVSATIITPDDAIRAYPIATLW